MRAHKYFKCKQNTSGEIIAYHCKISAAALLSGPVLHKSIYFHRRWQGFVDKEIGGGCFGLLVWKPKQLQG